MSPDGAPAVIVEISRRVLTVLNDLEDTTRAHDLPALPAALRSARLRILDEAARVAVVGEAKRGKSTFVNALIGRPLLPVDLGVATKQVFYVSAADRERIRLRFEDDSAREISAGELVHYGSETADDAAAVALDQVVRWIEVETPVRSLPANVHLLDTPGLGSLYAAHARTTQRFLPYADAVIFVLDSGQPIEQSEVQFIEAILAITPHIFFVQTRIDIFRVDQWQDIQRRNEEIIAQRFGRRIVDGRVWPIASTLVLMAAQTGQAALLQFSRQGELIEALHEFLQRAGGLQRTAAALALADHFQTGLRPTLATRLAVLADNTVAADPATARHRGDEQIKEFAREWSPAGAKRQDLTGQLHGASREAKRQFMTALAALGQQQERRIDAIRSPDVAVALGAAFRAYQVAEGIDTTAVIPPVVVPVQALPAAPAGVSIPTGQLSDRHSGPVSTNQLGLAAVETLEGHRGKVNALAFSRDGRFLLSGSDDKTARVWELGGWNCTHTFKGHDGRVWAVSITMDGQIGATVDMKEIVRLWDLASGDHLLNAHPCDGQGVPFSFGVDGVLLGGGGYAWSPESISLRSLIKEAQSMTFLSTGKDFEVYPSGQSLWFYKGSSYRHRDIVAHPWEGIAFDAKGMIYGNGQHRVDFSDYSRQGLKIPRIAVVTLENGNAVVSAIAETNRSVEVFQNSTRKLEVSGPSGFVHCLALSPNGKLLAFGGIDGSVRLRMIQGDAAPVDVPGHQGAIETLAFSPDGRFLASAGEDAAIRIWGVPAAP